MTELTDLSETDASNTTITSIDIDEGCAPSGMNNAVRNTLGLIRRAFKSSIFRLRDSTDQTKLLAYDLSALTTATTRTQIAPDENGRQALAAHLSGYLYGLTLSNNVADATNDIDIAVGNAIDSTNTHVMTLASALTKRLDAAWAVGTNQGMLDGTESVAGTPDTSTWYHLFLIKRVDTGVVDILASESATAPTMPTNYTLKRRIGAVYNNSSGDITGFVQVGDRFLLKVPVLDTDTTNPGTSAVTETLDFIPSGVVVDVIMTAMIVDATSTASIAGLVTSVEQTDTVPVIGSLANLHLRTPGAGVAQATSNLVVRTNTSRQVRYRISASDADISFRMLTEGWIDTRGRV